MIATVKAKGIDLALAGLMGKDRTSTIEKGKCVRCTTPDLKFKAEINKREYQISGMCQRCQEYLFEGATA